MRAFKIKNLNCYLYSVKRASPEYCVFLSRLTVKALTAVVVSSIPLSQLRLGSHTEHGTCDVRVCISISGSLDLQFTKHSKLNAE